MATDVRILPMRKRDLAQVMAIEQEVFPEPWSRKVFVSELAQRRGREYRVGKVARAVVGYFGLMLVEDEAHVSTIAVASSFQHQGIATLFMLESVRLARENGVKRVTLEVAVSNERAMSLYRRFGFAPVGVRKGYYQATGEDAYLMVVEGVDTPAYATRMAGIIGELRSAK